MNDLISRKQAIKIVRKIIPDNRANGICEGLRKLKPIQPNKDKVSNLLYHIYSIQSPHLDMNGVIAKQYYCEELWKELFGKESELPRWMN